MGFGHTNEVVEDQGADVGEYPLEYHVPDPSWGGGVGAHLNVTGRVLGVGGGEGIHVRQCVSTKGKLQRGKRMVVCGHLVHSWWIIGGNMHAK